MAKLDGAYTLGGAGHFAMKLFEVGTGKRPDLARTGLSLIDNTVGGLFPGTLVVVGAEQGVGKSSLVLSALFNSPDPVGAIFLEDGPDLVGGRALAMESGVNSLDLRFSERLPPGAVKRLQEAQERLKTRKDVFLEFALGGSMETIETRVERMGKQGVKACYLDYLTKIRGLSADRRSEIGTAMVRFQKSCQANGIVPIMLSQLRRQNPTKDNPDPRYDEPNVGRLKESGDIEGEARVILMAWPSRDGGVNVRLAKSSFGGQGARTYYSRDDSGSLRETRK